MEGIVVVVDKAAAKVSDESLAHEIGSDGSFSSAQGAGAGDGHDLQYGDLVETKFGIGSILHRESKITKKTPFSRDLHTVKMDWGRAYVPCKGIKRLASNHVGRIGLVQLTQADLWRLGPGRFLNDNCIDAMRHTLISGLTGTSVLDRVHIFNSFFNTQLRNKNIDPGKIVNMTKGKGIDVLSKDFLFVPINKDLHWSLAVVCNVKQLKAQVGERVRRERVLKREQEESKRKELKAKEDRDKSESGTDVEEHDDGEEEGSSAPVREQPEVLEVQGEHAPSETKDIGEAQDSIQGGEAADPDVLEVKCKPREMFVGRLFYPDGKPSLFRVALPAGTLPGENVKLRLVLGSTSVEEPMDSDSSNDDTPGSSSSSSSTGDVQTVTAIVPTWFVSCMRAQEVLYDSEEMSILPLLDNLAPCVLLFDSLKAHSAGTIMRNLRKYLGWSISQDSSSTAPSKASFCDAAAESGDADGGAILL